MFQSVVRRPMADHEDGTAGELAHDLREPSSHTPDHLLIALTLREWIRQMEHAALFDLRDRPPGKSTIVAFTEPGVVDDCGSAFAESNFGGSKGSRQVRAEYRCEIIPAPTCSERPCLFNSCRRQGRVEPTGCEAGFVVHAGGVSLKDNEHRTDTDNHSIRHQQPSSVYGLPSPVLTEDRRLKTEDC